VKDVVRKRISVWIVLSIGLTCCANSFAGTGEVWLAIGEPLPAPARQGVFETALEVSTFNATLGAYLVTLHFDPAALQVLEVTIPSGSEFQGNTFADEAAFASGMTDICGIQTAKSYVSISAATFATVKWKVLGAPGQPTTVELTAKTMVDALWRPIEVHNSSVSFDISSRGDIPGDTDCDGDVDLADLGALAGAYGTTSGATWEQGDFDGDGDVDLVDLGALAGNYGYGVSAPLNFAADAAKLGLSDAKDATADESSKEDNSEKVLPVPGGCIPTAIVVMMCMAGAFFWLGSYERVRS
jgi:hypothetical protein